MSLQQIGALIKKISEEVLPPDITLYYNHNTCLFEMRGSAGIIEDYQCIFLVKEVQGFKFTYLVKFKDLELISKSETAKNNSIPYIKSGIEEAIIKFNVELSDPVKMASLVEKKKKEEAEFQPLGIQ